MEFHTFSQAAFPYKSMEFHTNVWNPGPGIPVQGGKVRNPTAFRKTTLYECGKMYGIKCGIPYKCVEFWISEFGIPELEIGNLRFRILFL